MDINAFLKQKTDPIEVLKRCIESVNRDKIPEKSERISSILQKYAGQDLSNGFRINHLGDHVFLTDKEGRKIV